MGLKIVEIVFAMSSTLMRSLSSSLRSCKVNKHKKFSNHGIGIGSIALLKEVVTY